MRLGDVVDEFHHVHGLTDAGAAEQADLTAFGERANQVNHFDAGFQQFLRWGEFIVGGGFAVNRRHQSLVNRAALVDGRAEHVHDAAQCGLAYRHRDVGTGVVDHVAAAQTVGRAQRNGAHDAVAELLLHFKGQRRAFHFERVINARHFVALELYVHHSANTLNNLALSLSHD